MRRDAQLAGVAVLVAVTLVAYIPALRAGYIWDDDTYVTQNALLRNASGLVRIWFQPGATPQYYPLVYSTYWLEYHLWGLHPVGYHGVNIALHAANAVLLWCILRRLNVPGAWVVSAVFALHPMHVQSVAWIAERKNVLSALLYFLSILAYLRWRPLSSQSAVGPTAGPHWYALALLSFLATLLSKTVLCTLPAALLLIVWWKHGRLAWRDVRPLIPFLLLGLILGVVTIAVEAAGTQLVGQQWHVSALDRAVLAGRAAWFYVGKLLLPLSLAHVYPRWTVNSGPGWQYLYPLAALASILALWLLRSRLGRGPLVAVLFFGGTLLPALGVVDFAYMQYSFVADHFVYVPSVAILALAIASVAIFLQRLGPSARRLGPVLASVVLLALGSRVWQQARIYENTETLWRDTLAKNPGCWAAHFGLGTLLAQNERAAEAIPHFEAAFDSQPTNPAAWINLAAAYNQVGRSDDAVRIYEQVLTTAPQNAVAHYNLGVVLAQNESMPAALDHFIAAVRNNPRLQPARQRLAPTLLQVVDGLIQSDDAPRAVALAERACAATEYADAPCLRILAAACQAAGDDARAAEILERARTLEEP